MAKAIRATETDFYVSPVATWEIAIKSVLGKINADVGIVKSDSPDPMVRNQLLTYILRVTNNGPAVATGVTVNVVLSALGMADA